MDLNAFQVIVKSENKAKLYLLKFCWKKGHVFCSVCYSYRTYRIWGKKYRCKRCGYTFHDFSNRWLNRLQISPKTWLWILKLFELEVSARRIAQQLGISYPTALKAVNVIRSNYSITCGGKRESEGDSLFGLEQFLMEVGDFLDLLL